MPSGTFCSMRNQMGRRVHFLWHCAHARAQTRLGTRGHPSATARVKTWTVRRRTGRGRRLPAGGAVSMGQRRGHSAGALLPHLTPQPCVYFAHGTLRTGKGTPSRPEAESDKRPRPPWNQAGGAAPEGARPGAWTPRPAGPAAAGCALCAGAVGTQLRCPRSLRRGRGRARTVTRHRRVQWPQVTRPPARSVGTRDTSELSRDPVVSSLW